MFIEAVDSNLEVVTNLLRDAGGEVMGALRFYRCIQRDGRFGGSTGELRDGALGHILQRRGGGVARVTNGESGRRPWCVAGIDAWSERALRRRFIGEGKATTK